MIQVVTVFSLFSLIESPFFPVLKSPYTKNKRVILCKCEVYINKEKQMAQYKVFKICIALKECHRTVMFGKKGVQMQETFSPQGTAEASGPYHGDMLGTYGEKTCFNNTSVFSVKCVIVSLSRSRWLK